MLDTPVTLSVGNKQEREFETLAYFRKRRAACIRAYRSAEFWVLRREARANALRYSKMVRKMEVSL